MAGSGRTSAGVVAQQTNQQTPVMDREWVLSCFFRFLFCVPPHLGVEVLDLAWVGWVSKAWMEEGHRLRLSRLSLSPSYIRALYGQRKLEA